MVAPAFAFVVGYFFAFDISWFPLFSLSEHIVFAIRALPIAVGASVAFLITLALPRFQNHLIYRVVTKLWILSLVAAAILVCLYGSHLGLAITFALVAFGAYLHHRVHGDDDPMSFRSILYWAITLTVACLIVGWFSAWSWRLPWLLGFKWGLPAPMFIRINDASLIAGHIVFMGDKNILFYRYGTRTTCVLRREDVTSMFQFETEKDAFAKYQHQIFDDAGQQTSAKC
jgi:MFS family permease